MQRGLAVLASVLTLCTAACGGAADATSNGTTEDAIIGGQADPHDAAIVELVEALGADEYTCTATFISTTAPLTAHVPRDEGRITQQRLERRLDHGASRQRASASRLRR